MNEEAAKAVVSTRQKVHCVVMTMSTLLEKKLIVEVERNVEPTCNTSTTVPEYATKRRRWIAVPIALNEGTKSYCGHVSCFEADRYHRRCARVICSLLRFAFIFTCLHACTALLPLGSHSQKTFRFICESVEIKLSAESEPTQVVNFLRLAFDHQAKCVRPAPKTNLNYRR